MLKSKTEVEALFRAGKTQDLSYCDLNTAKLEGERFEGISFYGSELKYTLFNAIEVYRCHFTDSTIEYTNFVIKDLHNSSFLNSYLKGSAFNCSDIYNCDFRRAVFNAVHAYSVTFTECDFSGADLTGILYNKNTKFIKCIFDDTTKMGGTLRNKIERSIT